VANICLYLICIVETEIQLLTPVLDYQYQKLIILKLEKIIDIFQIKYFHEIVSEILKRKEKEEF